MTIEAKRAAYGRITLVQEQRFRLLTDSGQSLLLTLSADSPRESTDLCDLEARQARICVEFSGEPGLESAVAHAIREL